MSSPTGADAPRRHKGARSLWREGGPSHSGKRSERDDRDNDEQDQQDDGDRRADSLSPPLTLRFVEAAPALLQKKLFPIFHAWRGLDENRMDARLSCDGALAAGDDGG